jgi:predicted DNA binding CopG/RHH family protein
MLEELKTKTFASEAEEAAWWESHEDELADEFEKATAEGRVGIGTVAKRAALPSTTIRLDPDDIAKARVQAAERGLRYQTYLKMIIHEALRKAEASPTSANSEMTSTVTSK